MYQPLTPITQRELCDGVSGWALLGLATVAQRPEVKRGSGTWYHNSQDERNFHWRDR
jgi:hypothetical protein